MPMYDVNQKKKVNYYGVFTLWAAILILASYFVLYTSGCGEIDSTEVQCILAATFVLGILLFLLSFCNLAVRLFHRKCFFYLIVLSLILLAASLLYAAYQTLGSKCERTLYYERNYSLLLNSNNASSSSGGSNITELPVIGHEIIRKTFQSMNSRRSDHYIVSAVLDLIASLLFAGSAYAFRHRI